MSEKSSDQPPAAIDPYPPSEDCAPLWRLPVDKSKPAVQFLLERGEGVMDLIAHFWDRLSQTPPLQRSELHLLLAGQPYAPISATRSRGIIKTKIDENTKEYDLPGITGAMLYVPKAHRADVLALDTPTANAFVKYIRNMCQTPEMIIEKQVTPPTPNAPPTPSSAAKMADTYFDKLLNDKALSTSSWSPFFTGIPMTKISYGMSDKPEEVNHNGGGIDFLTGGATGIQTMLPDLLTLVHKRNPAKQVVNVVMHLPEESLAYPDPLVRLARDSDLPTLNRWRKQYKEERGILFDADLGSWVSAQKIYVCEDQGQVVAVAKFDLDLPRLIEIGGIYTFPEFRGRGYGARIVRDLAARIRTLGKTPMLQVDRENANAHRLYEHHGWRPAGMLARIWLTPS